jgi:hypothetical protein
MAVQRHNGSFEAKLLTSRNPHGHQKMRFGLVEAILGANARQARMLGNQEIEWLFFSKHLGERLKQVPMPLWTGTLVAYGPSGKSFREFSTPRIVTVDGKKATQHWIVSKEVESTTKYIVQARKDSLTETRIEVTYAIRVPDEHVDKKDTALIVQHGFKDDCTPIINPRIDTNRNMVVFFVESRYVYALEGFPTQSGMFQPEPTFKIPQKILSGAEIAIEMAKKHESNVRSFGRMQRPRITAIARGGDHFHLYGADTKSALDERFAVLTEDLPCSSMAMKAESEARLVRPDGVIVKFGLNSTGIRVNA